MQDHGNDFYVFLAVMCLPFLGWVVARPPVWRRVRARLEPWGLRLWQGLVEREQPDDEVLRLWAGLRLEQLRGHLERVRRLTSDDEWMTATRQMANRLAYRRLLGDVREAEMTLSTFGPIAPTAARATPTPVAAPRIAFSAPTARSTVEVMEFGPSGRWI